MNASSSKIALKPYLERIKAICGNLSTEELTEVLLSMAKGVPVAGRIEFLDQIEDCLPGRRSAYTPDADDLEEFLNDVEALKEAIEERIGSIEDGSYWDDPDEWHHDYYDEDPDYVTEDQADELANLFESAGDMFISDQMDEARRVYGALLGLVKEIEAMAYISLSHETDIREARARYCRAVYETTDEKKRLDKFLDAMEVGAASVDFEDLEISGYPIMQDVIDARAGEMEGLADFWVKWDKALSKMAPTNRAAELRLEAIYKVKGIDGVVKVARSWEEKQPRGYLFWLDRLKEEKNWKEIVSVSLEALKALSKGRPRERAAGLLSEAGMALGDNELVLRGKRERLFSNLCDQNLLDLLGEAINQDARDKELKIVMDFMKSQKKADEDEKPLLIKVFLMAGRLEHAFDRVKKEKSVGWSFGSVGVVFGSILSVATDHDEAANTVQGLLKGYAEKTTVYSGHFSTEDGASPPVTFHDEIVRGLKQASLTKSGIANLLKWARKIGENRINHIVSNKHRRAYDRAAQVLGALAEVDMVAGDKSRALGLLDKYYNQKFNRFSAFRREVKSIVNSSGLIKELAPSVF